MLRALLFSLALVTTLLSAAAAEAQLRPSGFTISVTAGSGSSVAAALSAPGPQQQVTNNGTNGVWVNFGTSSGITAAVGTGYFIPAGGTLGISPGVIATYIAAYGVGGTSVVYDTPGTGPIFLGGGGGGSGGGGGVVAGNVSNAGPVTISSTNLGVIGNLYSLDPSGAVWDPGYALSVGGKTYPGFDTPTGSNLLNAINGPIPCLAVASPSTVSAGTNPAVCDLNGRLWSNNVFNGNVPSLTNPIWFANAEAADVTGTFTNATQTTSVTNSAADGYASGLISINGTYATATGVFEVSDDGGTTFYSIQCARSDGSGADTGYTALTNTNRQWTCPVGGNDSLRVRSTAVATGTVNARVGVSAPPPPVSMGPAGGPSAVTPAAGTAHIIATGGTAVTFVTGPVKGCYITNPLTATDQNIGAAEPLYVNDVTTATTVSTNGSSVALAPGQTFYCAPGKTNNVSANALTSAHNAVVVQW